MRLRFLSAIQVLDTTRGRATFDGMNIGGLAQLGERDAGSVEVRGSSPLASI